MIDHPDAHLNRRELVAGAALAGAALVSPFPARAQEPSTTPVTTMPPTAAPLTAEEIRTLLDLTPNATCGYVRVTFESKHELAAGTLPAPYGAARPLGSALYFMVTPEEPVKLHRISNDQLYHYYLGDPLEVLMMKTDGTTELVVVGPDLRAGQLVQLLIPGGTFHTARVIGSRQWFLGASTEWPGVIPADVELGNADELAAKYPSVAADIRSFPVPSPVSAK